MLDEYNRIVDALRERRRDPSWNPYNDRPVLEQLESLYDMLSPEEQSTANLQGWRGWPDLYDARMT